MTETSTYLENHESCFTHCSPRIYNSDFDAHQTMRDVVDRIVSDLRFDEQCRKNSENRRRMKTNVRK